MLHYAQSLCLIHNTRVVPQCYQVPQKRLSPFPAPESCSSARCIPLQEHTSHSSRAGLESTTSLHEDHHSRDNRHLTEALLQAAAVFLASFTASCPPVVLAFALASNSVHRQSCSSYLCSIDSSISWLICCYNSLRSVWERMESSTRW